MMTTNMKIMFIVGSVIFFVYIYALLRAIYWGHNSQREDMLQDPELRNYYARHNEADFIAVSYTHLTLPTIYSV